MSGKADAKKDRVQKVKSSWVYYQPAYGDELDKKFGTYLNQAMKQRNKETIS